MTSAKINLAYDAKEMSIPHLTEADRRNMLWHFVKEIYTGERYVKSRRK
jgi:hypothetical protein